MDTLISYWQTLVSWWDAIVAFGGLMIMIMFGYWSISWAYRFTKEDNQRSDDIADFASMDLSKDERHAVAEVLQVRMVR